MLYPCSLSCIAQKIFKFLKAILSQKQLRIAYFHILLGLNTRPLVGLEAEDDFEKGLKMSLLCAKTA